MKNREEILAIAKQSIRIEAQTLAHLVDCISDDFVRCVQLLFEAKGRLIVTGIGKSAIIAQKIVATLVSTGTPALFMHAADAIHGDLGLIGTEDSVLCISKSGETPEIKVLVPFVKKLGNTLIGMVSREDSFLGRQAELVLLTPVEQEADPNNLAPTASTIAQMAMGDALAVSLLAMRGFTAQDFAQYHPGGALGKQLYLRVNDIYTQNEKPRVTLKTSLREIIVEMTSRRLGVAVVVDESEHVLGIITDGDLRRMLSREEDVSHLRAKDIMTANPKTIEEDTLAIKALEVMRNFNISQIIIVKNKKYRGIVHLHDLIKEGLV